MKEYKDLTFVDDFMFAKVMRNKDLCKRLLEIILQVKIRDIQYLEEQKAFDMTYDGKSVRLDVYVEDDENTVYDCEMQTTITGNLPKRTRYYQGMIDLNLIEKGDDYGKLKKSIIIFICTEDVFGKGLSKYTFENRCIEDTSLALGDGTTKIFLNAEGATNTPEENELSDFLSYLASGKTGGHFTKELEKEVQRARSNHEWEVEYMKFMVLQNELLNKGRAEGRAEGRVEEHLQALTNLLSRGGTEEQAKAFLDATDDEIEFVKKKLKHDQADNLAER